jgi:uncharacterized membrane protein YeaQ/YmgE (transglycosylase-associated protein family)
VGILTWIVFGLIAGIVAKLIMPGKDPGGFFITVLIGIAGAFVGGIIGSLIGFGDISGFDLRSMGLAVLGAVVLLFGYPHDLAKAKALLAEAGYGDGST